MKSFTMKTQRARESTPGSWSRSHAKSAGGWAAQRDCAVRGKSRAAVPSAVQRSTYSRARLSVLMIPG